MTAERIRRARLAAGMSLGECRDKLAERGVKVSKPALSYYENGKRTPNAQMLKTLGIVLGVQPSYFLENDADFSIEWYSYRARSRLGARKRQAIESYATYRAEMHFRVLRILPSAVGATVPRRKSIGAVSDADGVAAELRKRWKLGQDAIESVTQVLESHGIIVVHYNREPTTTFDGLSAMVNDRYALIIVNSKVPPDRLRFDLLHELGHVLMDTRGLAQRSDEEKTAHRFASSFLVPPAVLRRELGAKRAHLTLTELLVLKEKYGISVGALLYAAQLHGIIGDRLYVVLQKQLSVRGWRKVEPPVYRGNERPIRARQLVTRAVAEDLLSLPEARVMFPELKEYLDNEFTHESLAGRLRRGGKKKRDDALREAAGRAADDYALGSALVVGGGEDYYDYP